jgi:hypothetical protein
MIASRISLPAALAAPLLLLVACGSSDPTSTGGSGTIRVTTWGEEYIEEQIPAGGDGGFADGWSVAYDRFLVNVAHFSVRSSGGDTAGEMQGAVLFDHTAPGAKPVVTFTDVPAGTWDRVGYEIPPVTEDTELGPGATAEDRSAMAAAGYSLYVEGAATKGDVTKTFAWGFAMGTRYESCESEQDGKLEVGLVVKAGGTTSVDLTIHGDHPFYDRLQASPDPAVRTSLRFDALAAADADADGEVTLAELAAAPLDVFLYDSSGLGGGDFRAFVTSLARTVGHYRGEGECSYSAL